MKKNDLSILDNADDDIIDKLPPFSSDEATRKRVLSMSEKKFEKLMSEKNKGNDNVYEVSVSGVERYRRPVWHKALGVAAAVALIAGSIGTVAVIKNKSPKSGDSMYAVQTTEAQGTETVPAAEGTDVITVQAPAIDISNDEVRFMAAAYAPYLLDISAEQQSKLAAVLNTSEWTPCDVNEPLPDGESYTMYVYNNGTPYSLTLYGDNTVKLEENSGITRWNVPAETARTIAESACPEADENVLSGHLTWCDVSSINVKDIWKNTRAGAKVCDMTDKKDIFYKMNNALDYFDRASGTIKNGILDYRNYGSMVVSDFQVDLNTAKAYQRDVEYCGYYDKLVDLGEGVTKSDTISIASQDGTYSYLVDLTEGKYNKLEGVKHRIDSPTIPFEELRCKDDSFTEFDNWNSRRQMLGGIALDCVENYRMAVDYLQDYDKWDIVGTEEIGGRKCVHIKGTYDVEYDEVKSFDLYVDEETGVTVKENGYDANGKLIRFIVVENLKFNDEAASVAEPDLTGLKEHQLVPVNADGKAVIKNDGTPQTEVSAEAPANSVPEEARDK